MTSNPKVRQKALDRVARFPQPRSHHLVDPWLSTSEYHCQNFQKLLADVDAGNLISPIVMQPYWSRLWIVQEILLARRVTVCHAGIRIDLWT